MGERPTRSRPCLSRPPSCWALWSASTTVLQHNSASAAVTTRQELLQLVLQLFGRFSSVFSHSCKHFPTGSLLPAGAAPVGAAGAKAVA